MPHLLLKLGKTVPHCCGAIVALCCAASAGIPAFEYDFLEKELQCATRNHVEFMQIADTPIVYRTWGVWNVKGAANEATDVAIDFYNYASIFRHVYRCERIMAPKSRVSAIGTWFVDGRASLARVWSIGNIDTLLRSDSLGVKLIARQNENRYLEATWGRNEHGLLNYRTYGLRLAAFIVPVGVDSCRIGVVAQGVVKQAMPKWLIRLAIKLILPRLMEDLQREITRRMDLKKPKPTPWYDHWVQTMRRLIL